MSRPPAMIFPSRNSVASTSMPSTGAIFHGSMTVVYGPLLSYMIDIETTVPIASALFFHSSAPVKFVCGTPSQAS